MRSPHPWTYFIVKLENDRQLFLVNALIVEVLLAIGPFENSLALPLFSISDIDGLIH